MDRDASNEHEEIRRAHRSEALRQLKAALFELDQLDPSSVLGARCQHVIDCLEELIAAEA